MTEAARQRWLGLVAAERSRRRKQPGVDERAVEQLFAQLQQMAQRFAAAPALYRHDVDDMSPAEMLACHLLPEELRPPGIKSEDEIWAEVKARHW